jgi:hypothetical protein
MIVELDSEAQTREAVPVSKSKSLCVRLRVFLISDRDAETHWQACQVEAGRSHVRGK